MNERVKLELPQRTVANWGTVALGCTERGGGARWLQCDKMLNLRAAVLFGALLLAALPAGADELVLPAPALGRTGPVVIEYRLSAPATGAARLSVDWTDSYGRVVVRRVIRRDLTKAVEIPFTLDLRRAVAMRNQLRVRCAIAERNAAGRLVRRTGAASATFIARPPDHGWNDYQVIIWQTQTPAQLAALARLGVTAGQVFGMSQGFDPAAARRAVAPFLARNLRWYVENIATDFYAAYHRWHPHRPKTWLFQQAKRLYRENPTSRAAFIRTPSLSDPRWLRRIARRLHRHVRFYDAYRPLFYNLADEAGIADLAAAWDFDFSRFSLAGMRVWLKRQYGTLAALNREWGTHFVRWSAVMPMTTDQALHRSDGNYAAWGDFKAWMDVAFARAVRTGTKAIHAVDPNARSALEGAQMPGWGGYNYRLLAPAVDAMEVYEHGNSVEIARSLNPHLIILNTSSLAGPAAVHGVWHELLEGGRGLILWDPHHAFLGEDGAPTPRGEILARLADKLRSGLAAQLIASRRLQSPVAILYSPASYRLQWLRDRKKEGGAWADRGSATEWASDNAVRAATRQAVRALTRLGLEPQWVTRPQIDAGALRRRHIRLLVLPHAIALSPREAGKIRAFVAQGGLVVADAQPGHFDDHGRRLLHPLLAGLSGPVGKLILAPWLQRKAAPDERTLLEAMTRLLDKAGIRPPFSVQTPSGQPISDVDAFRWRTGRVTIFALQRDLPATGTLSSEEVVLRLPRAYEIYNLLNAGIPTRTDHLHVRLGPITPTFLAFSGAPLAKFGLKGPATACPGHRLTFRISAAGDNSVAARIFHIEVVGPTGAVRYYSRNIVVHGRSALWHLPLALNDPEGRWTIRATDVLSSQTIVYHLFVERRAITSTIILSSPTIFS